MAPVLPLRADHFGAGGVGQARQLTEGLLGRPARVLARVDGDQEGALERSRQIDRLVASVHAPKNRAASYRNCKPSKTPFTGPQQSVGDACHVAPADAP